MRKSKPVRGWQRMVLLGLTLGSREAGLTMPGCARSPYTTKTVHDDERIVVNVQQEVEIALLQPSDPTKPAQRWPASSEGSR